MSYRKRSLIEQKKHRTISTSICKDSSSNRLPHLLSRSGDKTRKNVNNFDKYYIHPTLRYKQKNENPKANPESYVDETFIYKNLHNQNFWNWVHPLDSYQIKVQSSNLSKKVNAPILEKFREYLHNKASNRVPIVVEQILNNRL